MQSRKSTASQCISGEPESRNKSRSPAAPTIQTPARNKSRGVENLLTLEQACSSEHRGAQGAFKDSMIHCRSAIHITYRDSLRSSSMREPRDPLLKVVITFVSKNRVS